MDILNSVIYKFAINHIDKKTLGILVYGSYIARNNNELSDIDLMIIL